MFGRKVYLRGEFDDCPWDKLYDRCLIRKVGDRVYMATAYMKADWAPYRFRFSDAKVDLWHQLWLCSEAEARHL